jgi:hypothetical protein
MVTPGVTRRFRGAKAVSIKATVHAAVLCLLSSPALAQSMPPTGSMAALGPVLPPQRIVKILRSNGLAPQATPVRNGEAYQVRAIDRMGRQVRVAIDARYGDILMIRPIAMGPRGAYGYGPYGPYGPYRAAPWYYGEPPYAPPGVHPTPPPDRSAGLTPPPPLPRPKPAAKPAAVKPAPAQPPAATPAEPAPAAAPPPPPAGETPPAPPAAAPPPPPAPAIPPVAPLE